MSDMLGELREALREIYRVESELGRGGMATVYVAEDLKHGRRVALKVISPEMSSSIDGDRFKREIQIAARLSHPHILPVFDSGDANGLLYYTMPLVEGESLAARIDREKQISIDDAIALTCEVADALSYAHGLGVIHRDIKPDNILIHGGHAVVADFGIARVLQDLGGDKLTQTGMSVGTAAYMSPEQFSGDIVDGRSDMYSLACVLYEMLVGQVPFTGPNAMAIMARHTMEMVPSIRIVRQTVPDEVESAIMHALEKVPADRFASVADFKQALLGGPGTATYRRPSGYMASRTNTGPMRRKRIRRKAVYGGVTLAVIAAFGLAAQYYRTSSRPRAAVSDADLRRIAVLYLDDQSRDSSLRHVADGLTETLISQLSQVEGLDIVSSGGVAPYRGTDTPDDSIARVLKAGMLVRGGVERRGGNLRVSVQLVDGHGGGNLGRESFTVAEGQVLAARDSLARVVADVLRGRLGEEVRMRELRSGTASADAWALVQRAENEKKNADRMFGADKEPEGLQRLAAAESLATKAAALDAHWAQPEVELGGLAFRKARLAKDAKAMGTLVQSALDHSAAALKIDPRNADALELAGTAKYFRVQRGLIVDQAEMNRTITEAEQHLRDAVAAAPRQASAWNALSVVEYGKKNVPESYLAARRAYEADSYLRAAPDILWRLYATSYDLEQFPDAIHWCAEGERRFASNARFVQCRLYLMLSKAVEPDPNEAWRLVGQLKKLVPPAEWEFERRQAQMLVAIVLGRAKLVDSAHAVIAASRATPEIDPRGEVMGQEALARTFLGERKEAITLIERYLTNHPDHRAGFGKVNAWWWRDLQKEPRFQTLAGTGR